jgi:hypothetical protein
LHHNHFIGRYTIEQHTRAQRILTDLLSSRNLVLGMIDNSFLNAKAKLAFANAYQDKLRRMDIKE